MNLSVCNVFSYLFLDEFCKNIYYSSRTSGDPIQYTLVSRTPGDLIQYTLVSRTPGDLIQYTLVSRTPGDLIQYNLVSRTPGDLIQHNLVLLTRLYCINRVLLTSLVNYSE